MHFLEWSESQEGAGAAEVQEACRNPNRPTRVERSESEKETPRRTEWSLRPIGQLQQTTRQV